MIPNHISCSAVDEAKGSPASPVRCADTEVVRLVDSFQFLHLLFGKVDDLQVGLDTGGGDRLREDYLNRSIKALDSIFRAKATRRKEEKVNDEERDAPLTLGVLAWNEMRTFAGVTEYLSAIFLITSFSCRGELSEPRGE